MSTYRVLVLRMPCIVNKIWLQLFNGYRISVGGDGRTPEMVRVGEECEWTNVRAIHLKMPKANCTLRVLYPNKNDCNENIIPAVPLFVHAYGLTITDSLLHILFLCILLLLQYLLQTTDPTDNWGLQFLHRAEDSKTSISSPNTFSFMLLLPQI